MASKPLREQRIEQILVEGKLRPLVTPLSIYACRKPNQEQCPKLHYSRKDAESCYSLYCSYDSLRKRFSYLETEKSTDISIDLSQSSEGNDFRGGLTSGTSPNLSHPIAVAITGISAESPHFLVGGEITSQLNISPGGFSEVEKKKQIVQVNKNKKKKGGEKGMIEGSVSSKTKSKTDSDVSPTMKSVAPKAHKSDQQVALKAKQNAKSSDSSSKASKSPTQHNGCPSKGGQKHVTSKKPISNAVAPGDKVQLSQEQKQRQHQQQSQQKHMQTVAKVAIKSGESPNTTPKSGLKKKKKQQQQNQEAAKTSKQQSATAKQSIPPPKQSQPSDNPKQSQVKQQQKQQAQEKQQQQQHTQQSHKQSEQLNSVYDGCNSNKKGSSPSKKGSSNRPPEGMNGVANNKSSSSSSSNKLLLGGDEVSETSVSSAKQIVIPQESVKLTTVAATTTAKTSTERTTDKVADNRNIIYLSDRARLAAKAALVADAVPFRLPVCVNKTQLTTTTSPAADKSGS